MAQFCHNLKHCIKSIIGLSDPQSTGGVVRQIVVQGNFNQSRSFLNGKLTNSEIRFGAVNLKPSVTTPSDCSTASTSTPPQFSGENMTAPIVQPSATPFGTEGEWLDDQISKHPIVLLSKTFCPYCDQLKDLLKGEPYNLAFTTYELDNMGQVKNGPVQQVLGARYSGGKGVPQLFINGEWAGTWESVEEEDKQGKFSERLADPEFQARLKSHYSKGDFMGKKIQGIVFSEVKDGPQPALPKAEPTDGNNTRWFSNGKKVDSIENWGNL